LSFITPDFVAVINKNTKDRIRKNGRLQMYT